MVSVPAVDEALEALETATQVTKISQKRASVVEDLVLIALIMLTTTLKEDGKALDVAVSAVVLHLIAPLNQMVLDVVDSVKMMVV